ncbi:MAG: hypothetical protein ACLFUF_02220 [Opitutales bacterium]
MDKNEYDIEAVARLFERLGADNGQARTMAAQLIKRASQVAEERNISVVDATESLLKQVIEARSERGSGSAKEIHRDAPPKT